MEQTVETQTPPVQPVLENSVEPRKKPDLKRVVILLIAILLVAGGVYAGMSIEKKQVGVGLIPKITPTIIPQPTQVTNETANWKTYSIKDITFKYPSNWVEETNLVRGSSFSQVIKDSTGVFTLSFSSYGNYNQATGKPYATIDEYVGMPYQVKIVIVGGQEGRQPLPRAGSENINSVDFFSKDQKFIYTLGLQTGDTALNTPESEVIEGQKLFDQILSTLRLINGEAKEEISNIEKIPVVDTSNWKLVNIENVNFKIPPEARLDLCTSEFKNRCGYIYWSKEEPPGQPTGISVYPYEGGSRRQQIKEIWGGTLFEGKEGCYSLIKEGLFGKVSALQIAFDGSWCQGGGGAIVVVVDDKLVVFRGLGYYFDENNNKVIRRSIIDTVISTLSYSN